MYNRRNTLSLWLFCLRLCSCSFCHFVDKSLQSQPLEERFKWSVWGNWCGPGHGGFEGCCGGRPCSSCKIPALGEWNYTMNVNACLSECLPRDPVDLACVWHDVCAFIHGVEHHRHCNQLVGGGAQSCYCNCVLLSQACKQNAHGVCTYFRDWAACWYCDLEVTQTPLMHFVQTKSANKLLNQNVTYDGLCDEGRGDVLRPTQTFCQEPEVVLDNFFHTGQLFLENPCSVHKFLEERVHK